MMKAGLCIILFLTQMLIAYDLTVLKTLDNEKILKWVGDGRECKNVPYFKSYNSDYINNLEIEVQMEQRKLDYLNVIIFWSIIIIIIIGIFLVFGNRLELNKYDGLALFLFVIFLVTSIAAIFLFFQKYFPHSYNAGRELRLLSKILLLVMSPFLFLISYIINKRELVMGLHKSKWVSVISFSLFILSGIFLVIIGIMVIGTPEIRKFGMYHCPDFCTTSTA